MIENTLSFEAFYVERSFKVQLSFLLLTIEVELEPRYAD